MQNAPASVGAALREARHRRGETLEAVAARADLSAAFLSRLERGEASTSISNLARLAAVLEAPLDALFAPMEPAPAQSGHILRRGRDAGGFENDAYRYKPLAGGLPHQAISVFELHYPPGRGEELGYYDHEGEEVLYVLEGRIDFMLAGKRLRLEPGDCLQFDARQPHYARNPGKAPARLLMIVAGKPGRPVAPSFARHAAPHSTPRRKRHEPGQHQAARGSRAGRTPRR
jgi:transcriptional regulator with XRE-family HTH domain